MVYYKLHATAAISRVVDRQASRAVSLRVDAKLSYHLLTVNRDTIMKK